MKIRAAIAVMTALVMPMFADAQVITNDPANLAQNLMQVQQMVQQLTTLKEQLTTQQSQLDNMSGAAGYGGMVSNGTSGLKQNLPEDWNEVYTDSMNKNSAFSGQAAAMTNKSDAEVNSMSKLDAVAMVQERQRQKGAYDRVMAQTAYNNQMKELNDIQTLTNQIDSTSTSKQIADLQARIGTAQGAIQGEQTKLQLMSMLQQSQDKVLAQQEETAKKRLVLGDDTADNTPPNITGK